MQVFDEAKAAHTAAQSALNQGQQALPALPACVQLQPAPTRRLLVHDSHVHDMPCEASVDLNAWLSYRILCLLIVFGSGNGPETFGRGPRVLHRS